jgi:hypothetical protein
MVDRYIDGQSLDALIHAKLFKFRGDIWPLSAEQLLRARQSGLIKELPAISAAEVGDKSKGDILLKLLATVQVVWLIVQLITRQARGLPCAQLELMTAAFAVCAAVVFSVSLDRPQGPTTPIYIQADRPANEQDLETLLRVSTNILFFDPLRFSSTVVSTTRDSSRDFISIFAFVAASLVAGSVHLAAWDSPFPTMIEHVL